MTNLYKRLKQIQDELMETPAYAQQLIPAIKTIEALSQWIDQTPPPTPPAVKPVRITAQEFSDGFYADLIDEGLCTVEADNMVVRTIIQNADNTWSVRFVPGSDRIHMTIRNPQYVMDVIWLPDEPTDAMYESDDSPKDWQIIRRPRSGGQWQKVLYEGYRDIEYAHARGLQKEFMANPHWEYRAVTTAKADSLLNQDASLWIPSGDQREQCYIVTEENYENKAVELDTLQWYATINEGLYEIAENAKIMRKNILLISAITGVHYAKACPDGKVEMLITS